MLLVLLLLTPLLTSATEIYRFVDDNGSVHYVDTITKVPIRFRVQLLSPEEQARLRQVDTTTVLLFPYELVENDALKKGLWEDAHDKPITTARAVSFPVQSARISKLTRYTVSYSRADTGMEHDENLVVFKVKVRSKSFTDQHGKHVPYQELIGFILKSRMP
jgi:hypothetical protein